MDYSQESIITDGTGIEDHSNPYYLHHSQNPSISLVSQILTGDNYASWNRGMTIALSAKNKIGFVNGSITKPAEEDAQLISAWMRNNHVVISWILNSVSKEIAASLLYSNTAQEMWEDLKDRFQQSNGPKIYQLKHNLINQRQEQSSVSSYYTKIKTFLDELNNFRPICTCGNCTCGGVKRQNEFQEMEYVITLLMGLNESFASVRAQILLMDPIPTVNQVFSLLLQEEHQRNLGQQLLNNSGVEITAFATISSTVDNVTAAVKSGNFKYEKLTKKDQPYCSYCKNLGHTKDKCYKLHDFPPGHRSASNHKKDVIEKASGSGSIDNNKTSPNLDKKQIQQPLAMFSQYLGSTSGSVESSIEAKTRSDLAEDEELREYNEGETLWNIVDLDLDERALDKLQPHSSLKKLRIHSVIDVIPPIWLNNADLMSSLEYIQLDKCLRWRTLPPFGKLPFLKSLYLRNIPKAKSIIDFKHQRNEKDCAFPSLELLHIEELNAMEDWFDATITDDCFFPCLIKLYLKNCPNLEELPCLPPKLKSLKIFNLGWKTLSCRSISKSIPLEVLSVEKCPNITCISLADNITRFTAFTYLEIEHCPNLISLGGHQEVETTENWQLTLDSLTINNPSMLLMEPLRSIASLQALCITDNDELVSFSSEVEQWFLQVSSSLPYLMFKNLKSLRSLPSSLESIYSLEFLFIKDVPQLQLLPNFPASLDYLHLEDLESLQCLPSLSTISSLNTLKIHNVPLLQQLPDLPPFLEYLFIQGCLELIKRYNKNSGFDRDKLAHIPHAHVYFR